ncbi:H-type small acid-soluble spore protein [Brevibacillus ginsengisoli]|uniref:H-type small acid-soluble spore protein n=1 Tax=Brevibacillus ginsengisoli TaxID=363854 RepID=UPI003CE706B4
MNANRALQIINSEEKIQVTFQGTPVWIDGVEEETQTARVHTEGDPKDTKRVAIKQLVEQ